MQGLWFGIDAFLTRNVGEVVGNILNGDALEVENLTAGEDGWNDLVLLCGGQDEDGMGRRLFQCFKEGVEGLLREHVDLINDVDLELSGLWCEAHLVNQTSNIVHRVVRGGIEFEDIQG